MMISATVSLSSVPTTIGAGQIFDDPHGEAAEHRAQRIVDAAQQRAGEGVQQDARHHVGVQVDNRRHHHAGDRADCRGEAPAERQHPADADADQPRRDRIERRGPHRQPKLGVAEEQIDGDQHDERHRRGAQFMARDIAAEQHRAAGERRREGLDHVVERPAGAAVDDQQQADEHTDRASTGASIIGRIRMRSISRPMRNETTTVMTKAIQ